MRRNLCGWLGENALVRCASPMSVICKMVRKDGFGSFVLNGKLEPEYLRSEDQRRRIIIWNTSEFQKSISPSSQMDHLLN
jgi:hypothetical protein